MRGAWRRARVLRAALGFAVAGALVTVTVLESDVLRLGCPLAQALAALVGAWIGFVSDAMGVPSEPTS